MGESATQLSVDTNLRAALHAVPASTVYTRQGKRLFDLVVGFALAALLLPVALSIGLAVRVGLGSGVLYSQERVGRDGAVFTIWKFRTMRHDRRKQQVTEITTERRSDHKADDDPRHTGLGRLLRRLSLDELPQLWNVIRGDMSLVGPRPEVVEIAEQRGYVNHVRHSVRPGMTGPYQLSPLRLFGDLRDGLDLDAAYVRKVSFKSDSVYLLRTVNVMLGRRSVGS